MKLNNDDKKWLLELGETEEDFWQIEQALNANITKYTVDGVPVSRDEAIRLLGRKQFISGICRSVFHYTAARETAKGKVVLFDSSRLFM